MKLFKWKCTRLLGLIAFVATGGGLVISTAINEENIYKTEIILIVGAFFAISLIDHFKKLIGGDDKKANKKKTIYIIICALVGTSLTWYINHVLGYGAIVANGLVGAMAATFLPNDLAGITYTSSFVGMSSLSMIPSLGLAALGGLIVALVLLTTAEIYAGIGGKGGTTAALSTLITKGIISFFR